MICQAPNRHLLEGWDWAIQASKRKKSSLHSALAIKLLGETRYLKDKAVAVSMSWSVMS